MLEGDREIPFFNAGQRFRRIVKATIIQDAKIVLAGVTPRDCSGDFDNQ